MTLELAMMMMNEIPWWKKSVVYQIYPKSFYDANGDGIGDLQGIIQKLDYLVELGIDVLWLNPIYRSPQVDNGYDISNYHEIEPELGTMADFNELLAKAHEKGLKIILDLVVNHTSDQHPWFKQAKQAKNNAYHDYYIWKKPVKQQAPNNWGSSFGGSAWTYEAEVAEYYLHLFAKEQPDLNWENEQVRREIYTLMRFWLDKGIDGFRMDVISLISKDPAYPDGPIIQNKQYGSYYAGAANGPRVHEYLQEMNREVLSHYEIMTVGETPHTTVEEATKYTDEHKHELNMVFHFDHMHLDYGENGKFSTKRFALSALKRVFTKWQVGMAQHNGWNSLYWSNHDQARPVTRFGTDQQEYRQAAAKMLGTILHMQQGTPYIFEGEELGMTNARFNSIDDYNDIETKSVYKDFTENKHLGSDYAMETIYLKSRDNARTPMPWSATKNAGFTTGKPWLLPNPNYPQINVEQALRDPDSVFYYYQQLIKLRHTLPIVTTGKYRLLHPQDERNYTFLRETAEQVLFVTGNFTAQAEQLELPTFLAGLENKLIISNFTAPQSTSKTVNLPAYGAAVYLFTKECDKSR